MATMSTMPRPVGGSECTVLHCVLYYVVVCSSTGVLLHYTLQYAVSLCLMQPRKTVLE